MEDGRWKMEVWCILRDHVWRVDSCVYVHVCVCVCLSMQVTALIIENTFTSVEAMVSRVFPPLGLLIGPRRPFNFLVRNKWYNEKEIRRVKKTPMLLVVSELVSTGTGTHTRTRARTHTDSQAGEEDTYAAGGIRAGVPDTHTATHIPTHVGAGAKVEREQTCTRSCTNAHGLTYQRGMLCYRAHAHHHATLDCTACACTAQDEMVPASQMYELYGAQRTEQCTLVTIPGAHHMDAYDTNPQLYWSALTDFMMKYVDTA